MTTGSSGHEYGTSSGDEQENSSGDEGFVRTGDADVSYRTAGSEPALVFVHEGIADGRMWTPQFDSFATDYRVVAIDLRGFGRTGLPPTSYANHEDLQRVLDALDVERAHLPSLERPDAFDALFAAFLERARVA